MVVKTYENFGEVFKLLRTKGIDVMATPQYPQINIDNSEARLKQAASIVFRCQKVAFEWLNEYQPIADWLEDNKGKGLVICGDEGRGKNTMVRMIIPTLLYGCTDIRRISINKEYEITDSEEIDGRTDIHSILGADVIIISHVGADKSCKRFFEKIVSRAKYERKLLIISTDCTKDELEEIYGERTIRNLTSITKGISLRGESLYGKFPYTPPAPNPQTVAHTSQQKSQELQPVSVDSGND